MPNQALNHIIARLAIQGIAKTIPKQRVVAERTKKPAQASHCSQRKIIKPGIGANQFITITQKMAIPDDLELIELLCRQNDFINAGTITFIDDEFLKPVDHRAGKIGRNHGPNQIPTIPTD